MWHEARKREKATQKLFNEHKKRAERRREENRIDPNSLLQVHGLKSKLCLDAHIHKQASSSLVAWQGDKSVMIDRFDVRATLTSLPPMTGNKQPTVLDADESEPMKKLLNYERYRLVVQNDLNRVPEELRLKLVASSDALSDAKMKKLSYNKFGTSGDANLLTPGHQQPPSSRRFGGEQRKGAAIGFDYSSVPPPPPPNDKSSSSSRRGVGGHEEAPPGSSQASHIIDLDSYDNGDLDSISVPHQMANSRLDEIVPKYGLTREEFLSIARRDAEEVPTKDYLKDLKRFSRTTSDEGAALKARLASDQVYGPALPPELAQQGPASPSSGSSTPVRQRSPSGLINLPSMGDHDDDDDDGRSISGSPKVAQRQRDAPPRTPSPPSPTPSPPPPTQQQQQQQPPSPAKNPSSHHVTPVDSNGKDERLDSRASRSRDRKEPGSGSPEKMPPRRAATPLAYKRNRRSSRSMSQERRREHKERRRSSDAHRHHSTSRRSSGRRQRRRSRRRGPRRSPRSRSRSYSCSSRSSSSR